ncbi:hypothetical protein ACEWY4_017653 [Coilia grayii]|uniref:MYND-type domain-containing protein n=1 Tax=Coilia grayii TaxID=363190 RepID=A0ABD1JHP3_9TELE
MEKGSSKEGGGSDQERDRQYCELCGKMENLLKCGRCRNSFYCSKEHQIQDWTKHKRVCKKETDKSQCPAQPGPSQPPPPAKEGQQRLSRKNSAKQSDAATQSTSQTGPSNPPSDGERMKDFITSTTGSGAVEDNKQAGDGITNNTKPNGQTRSPPQRLAMEYIVPCMNKHGICVVDNFLGEETSLNILEDVKALYQSGKFTDGQLVSQKSDSSKDIRGDKITWIEGRESGCEKIAFLMSRMDDLVRHCNGKLGNYKINGRTKVSNTGNEKLIICR